MFGAGSGTREARRPATALGASPSRALRALLACGVLALALALLGGAPAQAQAPVNVLVFHGPDEDPTTDPGVAAIEALGAERGFTVEATGDAGTISAAGLDGVSAVIFLNTAGDLLDAEQEGALEAFIDDGGGFLGIGSAAESEPDTEFFDGLIGARPSADSSTDTSEQTVAVGDRVHPSSRELPLELDRTDVWYRWLERPTGEVHTVARYHATNAPAGDGTDIGGSDHPISWCRDYRGGRSFYTGMGRTAGSFGEAEFREHLGGAIQWAAGLLRGNCKATINSSYEGKKIVAAGDVGTGLATSGESHGLVVAPNGWVIYIGRGDCRTDTERGNLLGGNPIARILDHAQANVGIGCGNVHIWDPAASNGNLNSGITRAGTLAVYGDGGQGGERTDQDNHKMEYGLLGVTVAPDFEQTGHIYMQYFPTFNPASSPPGLPLARRVSKMSRPRISRFTLDLDTKQLDLASEVIVFDYDAQIYSCCHVGGGMGFDSAGNLYFTTGDTNSSQGSNGYSGNNPAAKCPTGPDDQPSRLHCGSARYSYQDARRTAGNTNDYNGKMLRIKPIPSVPDGADVAPGVGSTYTLPTAEDPNGANLFDGQEGGGLTKPEIYAMGLRNPSRLSIDPETNVPYTAWVGPDAGEPDATQGPSTYENAAQIDRAGNYGWPYCMGSGQAYRDRIASPSAPDDPAATTLRAANAPGYVSGGPGGATPGWYDCDNLRNDSPNNTGLDELPHATGTGKDAGKVRPANVWWSRGNLGDANGCPEFPREGGAGSAPNYGAQGTQLCPYVINEGLTVMNGPVYRYDGDAEDDSRRWPEYWDGRWFLHNSGGPSVKHGLLLDPATDQDGSQPVYADSLRDALEWDAAYMDSKFGPDGALYVQVYDGFFRANPNAGIWRYDYTGGPATPGAAPRAFPIGGNQVSFSKGASGGVSYEWDFGDGSAPSTEANPTHSYAEARFYTATLTVTYADGTTDTGAVTFDVIAAVDDTAPQTTATTVPADPNGTKPVTVSLQATDGGGTGVARTEYRVNSGGWQEYTGPFKRSEPGEYVVQYRSVDRANNVEEPPKELTFTISVIMNCEPNLNDEFDGGTLSDAWTVLRRDDAAISVANGQLALKIRAGDLIGDQATAKNVLLKDAPDGPWVVSTRLDVRSLGQEGQQAGLVLWNGESPNTFAKIVFINKGDTRRFEYVATREGETDIQAGRSFATAPREAYLRVRADGAGLYIPEFSLDGETWEPIAEPIEDLGDPDSMRFGVKASDNADADAAARFLYFRVDCSDRVAPTTTASVSPAAPDGKVGWYKTPPTVTLTADDGELGDVARIEYRIDGGATRRYTTPFTINQAGDHTVEYFATDAADEPNTEAPTQLDLRVDAAAPATQATVGAPDASGAVQVTLDGQDGGAGSGTVFTQYRVDGGPWKTYLYKDQQLFDGTARSLRQWEQAPSGRFDLMTDGSGGITPVGGLGMLWFAGQQFGDFRLKLQFREGAANNWMSNGGVFVRFPDPRTPLDERVDDCAKTGSAATSQAWVAIYCGHEIQLYDGTTGEPQKTGSIYNFDLNPIGSIGTPKPRGQWEDYEIEVRGQSYKIYRDGKLINEFENAPGQESSRGGDPPTDDRQFARGYIGLQNHGGEDTMQYRDIRVQDLDDERDTNATGAFRVSGIGPHTVEVRSVDAAGNVEPTKAVDFEIGSATPGGVGPSGQTPTPIPPASDDGPASFRLAGLPGRIGAKRFARRGITVPVACTGAMSGTAKLTVSRAVARKLKLGKRTLDSSAVRCYGAHTARVTLKPSRSVMRKLRKGARGRRSVKLRLAVQMLDFGKPAQTITKTITLR